ncbi:N-acetylmuramoyl-L-alanine amidase [Salinisphaera dokdonensis CL-ES53]|uniref:N-acetylmuramoyl-L-alanine amidase n=1 Tax=Salinisphaera dokdonensis CL-ES53 TaxID=1304272 RepID=A0ABV2AWB9_9GAMM
MRASLQWLVIGLLFCLSTVAVAKQATLKDVRLWASSDKTRVVFDLGGPTEPDLFMIDDPLRLVVDLPDARSVSQLSSDIDGSGLVTRVRTGVRHGKDLRVVLDLAGHVDPKSFMLDPDSEHGYRLVVDLKPSGGSPVQRVARNNRGESANGHDGKSTANANATAMAQASEAPSRQPARAEPVARTPERPSRDIVIVIDAGHGGKDPGALGQNGTREKDVVLQIARRLKAMVDDQPNMRGVLTRDSDTYIGLRQRMVEARKAKADLFLSIHADAAPRGVNAKGSSVYALSHHGATSEHARWLAQRENAADLVGGVSLKDKDDSLASFMLDLSQSASIEASLDAGDRVLQELGELGSLHKSKIQQAGFMVLKSPDIPSFLVETAFISTPEEERRLTSARYQNQLASAMLRGIKGYFASYRPATFIAEAQVHKVRRGETLSEIAQQYGVSLSSLRSANGLSGNTIHVGAELQIPASGNQQVAGLR